MFKKISVLFLCLALCLAVGCGDNTDKLEIEKNDSSESSQTVEKTDTCLNPLTGLEGLTEEEASRRPVAVMVNNISVAQPVQTGLSKADIVYETEVEGGITRLMAVFQDISKVEKVGTIRSARYDYIDLAMGHNAVYVHHGAEAQYATPHLKDTSDYSIGENNGGGRISNGLASEHTLYGYGNKMWEHIKNTFKTENANKGMWQKFSKDKITLSNTANSITVPFSNSYKTVMKYDAATEKYVRYFNGTQRKDYYTGEALYFKNVFVLTTNIGIRYAKVRDVDLDGGDGYYFVNGTYTPIKWKKGASADSLEFTNLDGSELSVNAGNSWVCIADKTRSQPVIE